MCDQLGDKTHSKHTQTVCCLPARARVNIKAECRRRKRWERTGGREGAAKGEEDKRKILML